MASWRSVLSSTIISWERNTDVQRAKSSASHWLSAENEIYRSMVGMEKMKVNTEIDKIIG